MGPGACRPDQFQKGKCGVWGTAPPAADDTLR